MTGNWHIQRAEHFADEAVLSIRQRAYSKARAEALLAIADAQIARALAEGTPVAITPRAVPRLTSVVAGPVQSDADADTAADGELL